MPTCRNDPGRFIGAAAFDQRAIESGRQGEGHVIAKQLLYVWALLLYQLPGHFRQCADMLWRK